jgi:hypothetical protein
MLKRWQRERRISLRAYNRIPTAQRVASENVTELRSFLEIRIIMRVDIKRFCFPSRSADLTQNSTTYGKTVPYPRQ